RTPRFFLRRCFHERQALLQRQFGRYFVFRDLDVFLTRLDVRTKPAVQDFYVGILIEFLDRLARVRLPFGFDQFDRAVGLNRIRVVRLGYGYEFFIVKNIRAEPSDIHCEWFPFELPYFPRKPEQLERLFKCNALNELTGTQAGKLRLFTTVVVWILSYLNVGAELTQFGVYVLTGLWIDTQFTALPYGGSLDLLRLGHLFIKGLVEVVDHFPPFQLAAGDFVELLFDLRRKGVVCHIGEVFDEEVVHDHGCIRGEQLILFRAGNFSLLTPIYLVALQRENIVLSFDPVAAFLDNVSALLNGRYGRRVRGRTANAHLFQLFHQARFRIARRMAGERLTCAKPGQIKVLPYFQGWQHLAVFFFVVIVGRLHIYFEKSFETDHFACSGERAFVCGYTDSRRSLLQLGIGHLRCDGTTPDQFVQTLCVAVHSRIGYREVGRTYRFVRLLRRRRLRFVLPGLNEVLSV